MSFDHLWDTSPRSYFEDVLMILVAAVAVLLAVGVVMAVLGNP